MIAGHTETDARRHQLFEAQLLERICLERRNVEKTIAGVRDGSLQLAIIAQAQRVSFGIAA